MTLWNAGALPDELTIDQLLKTHESIPRNPLIAEVCYKAGYIDSWGRGGEKIVDACKKALLPAPRFTERSKGILVELSQTPVKTPVKMPDQILDILREQSTLTLVEVAAMVGKSVSAVERAAKKLGDQGKLKYIGSQKSGHWKVME